MVVLDVPSDVLHRGNHVPRRSRTAIAIAADGKGVPPTLPAGNASASRHRPLTRRMVLPDEDHHPGLAWTGRARLGIPQNAGRIDLLGILEDLHPRRTNRRLRPRRGVAPRLSFSADQRTTLTSPGSSMSDSHRNRRMSLTAAITAIVGIVPPPARGTTPAEPTSSRDPFEALFGSRSSFLIPGGGTTRVERRAAKARRQKFK